MTTEKVALITAGGSGMGAGAARKLAADGFQVGVLSSSAITTSCGTASPVLWLEFIGLSTPLTSDTLSRFTNCLLIMD